MKLTAIIPVYNTPPYQLLEAIESIRWQSVEGDCRVILVDDGSKEECLPFSNCEVIRFNENRGTASALNAAHQLVDTEYVAVVGSDDINHPERFHQQLSYLRRNPDTDVLGTGIYAFYDDDIFRKPIFTVTHNERPKVGDKAGNPYWLTNHGTVIYRQSAVMDVNGYDEKVGRGQDVDLWRRMYKNGAVFRNIPFVSVAWRRKRG